MGHSTGAEELPRFQAVVAGCQFSGRGLVGGAEQLMLFSPPYEPPSADMAARYDRLKPREFFSAGGVSHYSCSS